MSTAKPSASLALVVVLAGVVAVSIPRVCRAGVVVDFAHLGQTRHPLDGPLPDYHSYLVSVRTDDGANVTGFDFGGAPGGDRGFFAPFLQLAVKRGPDGEPIYALTPAAASASNNQSDSSYDSHFLFTNFRIDTHAPAEDNDGVNPPGGPPDSVRSDYGRGSFLTGTFGLQPSLQATTARLLYVVLPNGSTLTYNGAVSTTTGTYPVAGTFVVPEPAGLSLLAAAGLALRRRRVGQEER